MAWLTIEETEVLIDRVRPFTMVSSQRSYSLSRAVEQVINADIDGDLVECGVWAGGLCMLMANIILSHDATPRKIWLYDTFAGMTEPDDRDVSIAYGHKASERWEHEKRENGSNWCNASEEDVLKHLALTGYPSDLFQIVKGDVLETVPAQVPEQIALLRLDTDWYASTAWELKHLYPKLSANGVLIVDDYSDWSGSRQAVVDYFGASLDKMQHMIVDGSLVIAKP